MAASKSRKELHSLTDDFVLCRTIGHSWDDVTGLVDRERVTGAWSLSLRCIRCTTERHDLVNYQGEVVERRYIYAEGYTRLKERVFRDELRRELMRRKGIRVRSVA